MQSHTACEMSEHSRPSPAQNYEQEHPNHTTSMILRGSGTRFFSTGHDMKCTFPSSLL